MKKLILFALAILLIIPLVSAQTISPFRDFTVIKEFDESMVAGNPNTAEISFIYKYKGVSWAPLVIRLNITSLTPDYSFTGQEFTAYGKLITRSLPGTGSAEDQFDLKCEQPPIKFEQTGDEFSKSQNMITFYCYNDTFYTVMPLSQNNVTLTIIPNIAIQPAQFNITVELLSEIGIIFTDPEIKIENGKGYLYIGYPEEAYLEFNLLDNQNLTLRITVYSHVFIQTVPKERPFGIAYFDIKNSTPFNGSITIIYYFNPMRLISNGYDVTNLRFYKYEDYTWKLVPNSGVVILNDTYAYAYAILPSLSIYGIFTSFQKNVETIYRTEYLPAQTIEKIEVRNITQIINQTVEKPIERIIEIRPNITYPVCGNDVCEVGETWQNCPNDCPEPKVPTIPTGYAILAEPGVFGAIIAISLAAGFAAAIGFNYLKKYFSRKEE